MKNENTKTVYTIVGQSMPSSCKGRYCTIRLHAQGVDPKGRDYAGRCEDVIGPMPWGGTTMRSRFFRTITELEEKGIKNAEI